ncbi:hypothetical protein W97_06645 [Coniosporium apollinis CBS 100218]|uniref:Uncharacterized protein n=1 Tax=Coniosporium apollinis (strain CBS 100218) TaxID=1168221 RepID=R7YZQ6_CONA1|nr:uncharacterized protein W97_06645 [Coniosporium apollinis CBS 100218]EON67392.1 hypothetical protein W97_06645 [Coniosporium apollinis CBS 100218]
MASAPVPRFLLPRPYLPLLRHQRALQRQPALPITSRNASSKSTRNERPIVLEKPDKFRPPSHGARLPPRKQPQYTYGARLTDEQIAEQKTKQYPHMMPPEGSFTHWILTNRMLHTWISLSVLFSLALFTMLTNFTNSTPYADLLPPRDMLLKHPIQYLTQFKEVYKMHTAYITAETQERRRRKVEDVQKRAEYRKAHGLEGEQGLGGWTAKTEGEGMGPALADDRDTYTDFEGKKRPVKKWLGIW